MSGAMGREKVSNALRGLLRMRKLIRNPLNVLGGEGRLPKTEKWRCWGKKEKDGKGETGMCQGELQKILLTRYSSRQS